MPCFLVIGERQYAVRKMKWALVLYSFTMAVFFFLRELD